jgi:hypothetical protein
LLQLLAQRAGIAHAEVALPTALHGREECSRIGDRFAALTRRGDPRNA